MQQHVSGDASGPLLTSTILFRLGMVTCMCVTIDGVWIGDSIY
jgi:hypothetical protein